MDRSQWQSGRQRAPGGGSRWTINLELTASWFYGALIVVLSGWILHGFLHALLVACVTAIASWPLYRRFAARMPRGFARSAAPVAFTGLVTVFVLAPLTFAFGALLTEAHTLLLEITAADTNGIAAARWLQDVPLAGARLAKLAHPGTLSVLAQRADPAALLGWAQSIGQFMARHVFIIAFAILVLVFLYHEGESLAEQFRRVLRHRIGERADGYVEVATRALRASVNSMLIVGLFDGSATGIAYAIAGVPHAALWGAIIGSLALVPFLGYAGVAALTLQLAMAGAATLALLSLGLGCAVLFCGDKIVRPVVARDGTHLPFVWVLMGCLGGFEALGLVGLVIGPVALALARELWQQRVRDVALSEAGDRC